MITSTSNKQIKNVIALQKKAKERRTQGVFVVEGIRTVRETPAALIKQLYFTKDMGEEIPEDLLKKVSYEEVTPEVMKAMSDTMTPQGVLAIVAMPEFSLLDCLGEGGKAPFLLVLETLQDPGNLGTIFRTAEGAGVTGIIMDKNTVDTFSPKVVRATMGSIYRVPSIVVEDLGATVSDLKERGIEVFAAHLKGENTYDLEDYKGATAFMIGNEGNGLSNEMADRASKYIKIPMEGQLESLNAAMAAGILMYEVHRQRVK